MTYIFDGEIASIVGVNAAVIFQNIGFWVMKNRANDKHFHDGNYWTYNSTQAFTELFPFLSRQQVRTAIDKLIDEDLIMTGDYNEKGFDRTKWYTLTRKGWEMMTYQPIDLPKSTNALAEINQPIPYINTDINKKESTNVLSKSEGFDVFWKAYPRKVSKGYAEKSWNRLKPPLDDVLSALEKQKRSDKWTKDNGKYIPYPSKWLNGKCWLDEIETNAPTKTADDRRKRLE